MDQLVTIEIFGQPFTFKADTDASKAKEVADYFAGEVAKMEANLAENGPTVDKRVILILTALNITQELFQFKKEHKNLLSSLLERSNGLIKQLNLKLWWRFGPISIVHQEFLGIFIKEGSPSRKLNLILILPLPCSWLEFDLWPNTYILGALTGFGVQVLRVQKSLKKLQSAHLDLPGSKTYQHGTQAGVFDLLRDFFQAIPLVLKIINLVKRKKSENSIPIQR